MLIYQISDLHIHDNIDNHVYENFSQLMSFFAKSPPDLLVLTGDLSDDDGSKQAYQHIKSLIPQNMNYIIVPGNHDKCSVIHEVFPADYGRDNDFCHSLPTDSLDLVFVNTSSYSLPQKQIDYLGSKHIRKGSVLFIHHPPQLISQGYMALKHSLKNHKAVSQAISKSNISHVFCGHFHNEYEGEFDGYKLYLTPSPAFKINLYSEKLQLEEPSPAFREIKIDTKEVTSTVIELSNSIG
ncbi:MAG: metallophosphoesterase [Planctomycetes bacterium]|nr:metallophosphoesterase [Planctomycetota bacterium]